MCACMRARVHACARACARACVYALLDPHPAWTLCDRVRTPPDVTFAAYDLHGRHSGAVWCAP